MADPRVTELLVQVQAGSSEARQALMVEIYDELRRMAAGHLRGERDGHTLQPTALVSEVYLKLFESEGARIAENRSQLFAVAARAMRQLLVDHARRTKAAKRGGGAAKSSLDEALAYYEDRGLDILELSEALEQLGELDAQLLEVVELRYFAGHSNPEIAELLGVSTRTAERAWATARSWLQVRLGASEEEL